MPVPLYTHDSHAQRHWVKRYAWQATED